MGKDTAPPNKQLKLCSFGMMGVKSLKPLDPFGTEKKKKFTDL